MAIQIFEKWKSREGTQAVEDPSISIVFGVKGTIDENEVDAIVDSTAPVMFNGLTRQKWTRTFLGPVNDGGLWDVSVLYDRTDPKGAGTAQLSADTSGGKVKITQSRNTIASYGIPIFENDGTLSSTSTPPDFRGAIGVTDTSIEGVDITTPKLELTITAIAAAASIDNDYVDRLDAAVGKINDFRFVMNYKGQIIDSARDELLFLGGPVTYRGNGDWEFVLKFIRERTVQDLEIGGSVTIPGSGGKTTGKVIVTEKKGQDYLWIAYKERKDTASNNLIRVAQGVYIERVYEEEDYSALFAPLNIEA
jgi:microcystin-dependent protein